MDKLFNNCNVKMVVIGQTIGLLTPLSNQLVKSFHIKTSVVADLRNEIREFIKLRKLTVINTRSLNWNPNL